MTDKRQIAVYTRVSTSDQDAELQRKEVFRYLDSRELKLHKLFEDKATGTNTSRPQFQQLMRAVRTREIGLVVVWKLDRFGRSMKDLVIHLNELRELDVEFVSIKDQLDFSTSSGRLMFHLLASFAEFEAALIKERVNAGIANARSNGIRLGRPPSINPEIAKKMRAQGFTLSAIAKRLGVAKSTVHKSLSKNEFVKAFTIVETIEPEKMVTNL